MNLEYNTAPSKMYYLQIFNFTIQKIENTFFIENTVVLDSQSLRVSLAWTVQDAQG